MVDLSIVKDTLNSLMMDSGNSDYKVYDLSGSVIKGESTEVMLSYQCHSQQICRFYVLKEGRGYRSFLDFNSMKMVFFNQGTLQESVNVDYDFTTLERVDVSEGCVFPRLFKDRIRMKIHSLFYRVTRWLRAYSNYRL